MSKRGRETLEAESEDERQARLGGLLVENARGH